MTTYSTDFSEYTVDQAPSDWTDRLNTDWTTLVRSASAGYGSKFLELDSHTSTTLKLLTWDDIDSDANRDDVEVLFKATNNGTAYSNALGAVLRGSDSGSGFTGYTIRTYYDEVRIDRYVDGSGALLDSIDLVTPYTYLHQSDFWFRFRVNGTTLSTKVWHAGAPEPPGWHSILTDSNVTGTGWVGLTRATNDTDEAQVDYFAVGTDGDSPSLPINTSSNIRVAQQALQVAVDVTNPTARVNSQALQVAVDVTNPTARVNSQALQVAVANWQYNGPTSPVSTDFSEYTTGQFPSDWTKRWNTDSTYEVLADSSYGGGKYFTVTTHITPSSKLQTWDELDYAENIDLLLRFRVVGNPGSDGPALCARASGELGGETGYRLQFEPPYYRFRLYKKIGGAASVLLGTIAYDLYEWLAKRPDTTWYARLKVNGTTIQAKAWLAQDKQPTEWQLEVTDSDISGAGYAGLYWYYEYSDIAIDYLSASFDSNPPPLDYDTDTVVRVTQVAMEVAVADVEEEASSGFVVVCINN
jgi:hypothetical protein